MDLNKKEMVEKQKYKIEANVKVGTTYSRGQFMVEAIDPSNAVFQLKESLDSGSELCSVSKIELSYYTDIFFSENENETWYDIHCRSSVGTDFYYLVQEKDINAAIDKALVRARIAINHHTEVNFLSACEFVQAKIIKPQIKF